MELEQVIEVEELLESHRKRYFECIDAAEPVIAESMRAHYHELATNAKASLADILDSAKKHHQDFVADTLAMTPGEVEKLAWREVLVLDDLRRAVEFGDEQLERFLRQWEGLH